jgi:hypothetical protein
LYPEPHKNDAAPQHCVSRTLVDVSVASRPKIQQNNSKPAEEKNYLQSKIDVRTAAILGEKRAKTGHKKIFV